MTTRTSSIPIDEWYRARDLFDIARKDESSGLGQVRLRSDGQMRRWYATDSVRAACIDGGSDPGVYDVGIPSALLRFSVGESAVSDELQLVIDAERNTITLRGSTGAVEVEDLEYTFPPTDVIRPSDIEVAGRATLRAGDLHNAVGVAWRSRSADLDDNETARIWFEITDGSVVCRVINQRTADSTMTVPCDATGQVAVEIAAHLLASVIDLFSLEDDIVVEIPRFVRHPVVIESHDRWCAVMPVSPPAVALRRAVEETIEEVLGPLAVRRDADGDYPLVRRETPIFARLLPDEEPPILQVFAVVVNGIEASPELMTELNDLNVSSTFTRVFHVGDQVLAEVDLVAETLDPVELNAAVHRVWDLGQRIMPTLSAVFGGEVVPDPAAHRLTMYRGTIVEAEVNPGSLLCLNGEAGAAEWPFPGVVHVLTGWDPQGVVFDPEENEEVNRKIASAVLEEGGRFVHGEGWSPWGGHSDPSLVVWGLSRDAALAIARRASREAIFEIDAETVRLVSCLTDDVEEWPRLS